MEIDPAALNRSTTNTDAPSTPPPATKALPGAGKDAQKAKAAPAAPRVELESYYNELKLAIGDQWGDYKEAVSQFVLGYLNQAEFSGRVEQLLQDPAIENVHNQLVCCIYANILRDVPETGVAPWVAANDKPVNPVKPPTGDAADQQLKQHVMHLPPRMRTRIKAIRDDPVKPVNESHIAHAQALTIQQGHDAHPSGSTAMEAPNTTGVNRDLGIRRRYQQPLISETHDLPPSTVLKDRILPICYQEGLHSGADNSELCSELVSTALGVFVKDMLTRIVSLTRCNAPVSGPKPDEAASSARHHDGQPTDPHAAYGNGLDRTGLGIMTAGYKQRLREEQRLWHKGELKRSDAGLLPVELQSLHEPGRGKCAPGDLRLAMDMDDTWIRALAPWQGERVVADGQYRSRDEWRDEDGDGRRSPDTQSARKSKRSCSAVNGAGGAGDCASDAEDEDYGWAGARGQDQKALGSLLDSCLDFG